MADAAFTPFPTINPTGAPRDYSNVRATPEEFGATVGQAESKMGAAVSQVGQTLFDVAKARAELQDELQANDLHSQKVNEMQSALSDFTKLQGDAANKALGGFSKAIGDITQTAIDGAPNLRTKALLSGSLRYTADRMLNYGRQHADTEFLQWQNQSAMDGATTHANGAALAALHNNPRDLEISLKSGIGNIVKWGEQNYRDPKPLVQKYVGETISKIVEASLAENNIDKAQTIFDKYKNQMDSGGLLASERALASVHQGIKVEKVVNDAVYGNAPVGENYRGYSDRSTVSDAIKFFEGKGWSHAHASGIVANLFQESGLRSTGPRGDSGYAMGAAQWHPDRQALLQKFATDHKLNPNDIRTQLEFVQWEMENTEKDAAGKIKATGSAGDAAAAADQFYERSSGEARGQRVSNAERFAAGNFSGSSPAFNVLPPKNVVFSRMMAATEDDQAVRTKSIARINQIYTDWNTENAVQIKSLVDNVPKMISDAEKGVDPETIPYPRAAITNYMPVEQGDRWNGEFDAAVKVGQLVKGLRWASPEDIIQVKEDLANGRGVVGDLLAKSATDPAEHYRLQSMGDARLTQMLKDRQAQLGPGGDPAKFVQSNPAVDAAFKAIDINDSKTYENFTNASLVVQHQLGVDFPYSHVLSKDLAQDMSKNIIATGAKAGDALDLLEKQTGAAWPQVFHDLATLGKLPTEYQGMHILTDPGDRSILGKAIQAQVEDKKTGWAGKLGQGDIQAGVQSKKDIDLAISGGMSNYINSLRMSDASEQEIDSVQHAVRLLGYGNKLFKGSDSAATDAVKSFVGNYSYMAQGGARVPTPVYETVNSNAQRMLEQLTVHDITLPEGVGQAGQPSAEAYLAQVKSAPMWITAKTGDRIYAKDMGGKWIRGADGNPISVMFSGPKAYESYTPKPDNYSGIINVYKRSLTESGEFTPEQVETMTRDYAKRFSSFGGAVNQFNPEPHLGAPVPNKDDVVPSPSPENPVAVLGVRG